MTREIILNRIWQGICHWTEHDNGNVTKHNMTRKMLKNRIWQEKCYLTEYDKRNIR